VNSKIEIDFCNSAGAWQKTGSSNSSLSHFRDLFQTLVIRITGNGFSTAT